MSKLSLEILVIFHFGGVWEFVPSPAQLSVACSTEKRSHAGRAWEQGYSTILKYESSIDAHDTLI